MAAGLTQQTAIIGAGRFVNMAAGAATLMVLARILPDKVEYGAVCQLIVLYMVLSQLFAVGLPQANYYFLPRFTGGLRRGFLTQTTLLLMCSGALLSLGLFFGAGVIGRLMSNPGLPALLRIFAIYPIFMLPTLAVESTLLHDDRPLTSVIFNVIVRVGMFCGLVIPTLLHVPLPQTITVWMAVAGAMWVAAIYLIFSTVRGLPFVWRPQMLHDEVTISLPLAAGMLVSLGAVYLDRFLVSHYFGPKIFGIYTNASLEVPTVTMVTNAMAAVLTSALCKQQPTTENPSDLPIWRHAMAKAAVVLFASFGFLAFWGQETMRVFFSDRFADSGAIFSIYVWVIPIQMIMLQPLFIARGVPHLIIYLRILGFALELFFVLLLGHYFGLFGIPCGVVISQYVSTVLSMSWFNYRLARVSWRALLPWDTVMRCLLIALGAGATSWLIHLLLPGKAPLLLRYGLGLSLFLACYLTGMYRLHLLGNIVPKRFLPVKPRDRSEIVA